MEYGLHGSGRLMWCTRGIVACVGGGMVYTRDLEGRHSTGPPHIRGLREWRPHIGIPSHMRSTVAVRPIGSEP